MAEIDDLVMQVERLENELKIANREIEICHKTIDRYEKWFMPRLIFLASVQKI